MTEPSPAEAPCPYCGEPKPPAGARCPACNATAEERHAGRLGLSFGAPERDRRLSRHGRPIFLAISAVGLAIIAVVLVLEWRSPGPRRVCAHVIELGQPVKQDLCEYQVEATRHELGLDYERWARCVVDAETLKDVGKCRALRP